MHILPYESLIKLAYTFHSYLILGPIRGLEYFQSLVALKLILEVQSSHKSD